MADWQELVDPGTGTTYYFNQSTNATQWDKPADFGGAAEVAAASGDAGGWTEVADEGSGKSYYYNATTCVTQWDPPPGFVSSAGKAAGGGVSGDAAKKDIGDRKAILARRSQIAKRSTAKPQTVGEKLAARAKKFVTLRKAEKAKSQPSAFKRKGGQTAAAKPGAAAAAPPAAAPAAAAGLPVGWTEVPQDGGAPYYYKATTGETQWERPTA